MKNCFKVIGGILIVLILVSFTASAHTISQEGVLERIFLAETSEYGIGGESGGWIAREGFHAASPTFSFCIIAYPDVEISEDVEEMVRGAAAAWSDVATIYEVSACGRIITCIDDPDDELGHFLSISRDSTTGHVTDWIIEINIAHDIETRVITHELGHAIGL